MPNLLKDVELEKDLQLKLKRKITDALRNATPGHLVMRRKYYYWRKKEDGVMVEKYIGPEETTIVRHLKRKKLFQKMLKIIDKNLKAIDLFLKTYGNYDPAAVAKDMAKAYRIPDDEVYEIIGLIDPKIWERNYHKKTKYPEHLTKTTDRGENVRSKSEVMIANALFANGIKYRYEPVKIIGGIEFQPDFEILSYSKEKIWEHFGKMNDPVYRDQAFFKIRHYMENGYRLWDNLIVTFDDENGNLDSRIVSRLIELYLL